MSTEISRRSFLQSTILATGTLRMPALLAAEHSSLSASLNGLSALRAVDFSKVRIADDFWQPKQKRVATITLQACIAQTEQSGRIRNFEKAARKQGEPQGEAQIGLFAADSDVYKALEAISYSLKTRPDVALESKADEWINKIAAAQLSDGYLNTYFTLTGLDKRWTDMGLHEDYCAGHLIEAAIAYYHATGKRKLLDAAIRFADHIDSTFRVPNRHWISGHEEIELALVKLFRETGDARYLKLAEWYLEQRGHGYARSNFSVDPKYWQDQVPVEAQREMVGHAVRAMYLYCGATDVTALTRDPRYFQAMKAVWDDVVQRKIYITGGVGSSAENEGFSRAFDLPNAQAYCETCASCGMVFWNHRMAQLTGEGQYIDVLERSLYNGALSGMGLNGDRFFYTNPLASTRTAPPSFFGIGRQEWAKLGCCPPNITRLVASLGGYVYAESDEGIWVNLFVSSSARCRVRQTDVTLEAETNYPWEGRIRLKINPQRALHCALRVRIPGWAKGVAVPSGLYRYLEPEGGQVQLRVNGQGVPIQEEKGYAVIERRWRKGDVVELVLPMDVQRVVARNEVEADRERVVLQRGPIVYCVEGADNQGKAWNLIASKETPFSTALYHVLHEPVVAIQGNVQTFGAAPDGQSVARENRTITAIPYYAWANRDDYEMQVWLPTAVDDIKVNG